MNDDLAHVYADIPKIDCKGLCFDSCGLISANKREREQIRDYRRTRNLPYHPLAGTSLKAMKNTLDQSLANESIRCPYFKDKRCTVYEVRPAICRLWGVTDAMPCLFGCKPDRMLTRDEANAILDSVG